MGTQKIIAPDTTTRNAARTIMQNCLYCSVFSLALCLVVAPRPALAERPSEMSTKQQIRVSDEVQITEAAQAGNVPERAAIEEPVVNYFKALNSGNLDAVLQLYTEDPVMLPFLLPTVVGSEAVRRNYEDTFRTIRFKMHTTIEELVQMSPEWAFVRTDSAGTFTPTKTGKGAPSTFHELFLLRKNSDGKWRIARYSFSPTAPLPDL